MVFDNIRHLRENRDLKQETVARYLNIGQATYSRYENGTSAVTVEVLLKLSRFYGVSVDHLLALPAAEKKEEMSYVIKSDEQEEESGSYRYERIKKLRKRHCYSQSEIVALLDIEQSTYSKYEHGFIPVPLKAVIKLADLYKVSIDYIVGRTNDAG